MSIQSPPVTRGIRRPPVAVERVWMAMTLSGSAYGTGASRTARKTPNIAVLAAIPSARVKTAETAKVLFRRRQRSMLDDTTDRARKCQEIVAGGGGGVNR